MAAAAAAKPKASMAVKSPPQWPKYKLSVAQLEIVESIKAQWAKKGHVKTSRKYPGFVDYSGLTQKNSGYPADAMDCIRKGFCSLIPREHNTFKPNHYSVYVDGLIAYIARCYSTSSEILLVGFDARSGSQSIDVEKLSKQQGARIAIVSAVLEAFGFEETITAEQDERRMNWLWSWKGPSGHGRDFDPEFSPDVPYPPLPLNKSKEVVPLRFRVNLRLFYDPSFGEQDQTLNMRALDIYMGVRRWNSVTPNLAQVALFSCSEGHSEKFLEMAKGTLDLNVARCANKGSFRPDPDVTKDQHRTPSNVAFYKFFDLNEAILIRPQQV